MLPIQLKQYTSRYLKMCKCKMCIHTNQLETILNFWRAIYSRNKNHYRTVVFQNNKVLNLKAKTVIYNMVFAESSDSILS